VSLRLRVSARARVVFAPFFSFRAFRFSFRAFFIQPAAADVTSPDKGGNPCASAFKSGSQRFKCVAK
jgi:hypothetical protein